MEGAKEVGWCGSRVIEWGWNRRGGLGRWKGKVDPSKMTGCIRLLRVHNALYNVHHDCVYNMCT